MFWRGCSCSTRINWSVDHLTYIDGEQAVESLHGSMMNNYVSKVKQSVKQRNATAFRYRKCGMHIVAWLCLRNRIEIGTCVIVALLIFRSWWYILGLWDGIALPTSFSSGIYSSSERHDFAASELIELVVYSQIVFSKGEIKVQPWASQSDFEWSALNIQHTSAKTQSFLQKKWKQQPWHVHTKVQRRAISIQSRCSQTTAAACCLGRTTTHARVHWHGRRRLSK